MTFSYRFEITNDYKLEQGPYSRIYRNLYRVHMYYKKNNIVYIEPYHTQQQVLHGEIGQYHAISHNRHIQ